MTLVMVTSLVGEVNSPATILMVYSLVLILLVVWLAIRSYQIERLLNDLSIKEAPTVKCNHDTKECNFRAEPCRYAHMQVEAKQATVSFDPTSTRKDYVHIYDKATGIYIGVRAIGHPDLNDSRHKIVWPNGQEVSHGCISVT